MTEVEKQSLIDNNVDLKNAMARFVNNEALYLSFLKKFPDDSNFCAILPNLESKNYDEAYKAAHALKGIAGNLGINSVFEPNNELLTLLKGNTEGADISAEAMAIYERIAKGFEEISLIIRAIE